MGDINQLELPPNAFDAIISIDSMYFSIDYAATEDGLHARYLYRVFAE